MIRSIGIKCILKCGAGLIILLLGISHVTVLSADTITVNGIVNQSVQDGTGPEFDLNFLIPSAQLHGQNAGAQAIPFLLPMDLLEDDGVTDIHGSVMNYSFGQAAQTPEPSPVVLLALALLAIALAQVRRPSHNSFAHDER